MLQHLKRLSKASAIYGSGHFFRKIIGFFLIPIYTRFLTPADYGILSIVSVIGSILFIVLPMGIDGAVIRLYYDYREHKEDLKSYLGTISIFLLGMNLIIILFINYIGAGLFEVLIKDKSLTFDPYMKLKIYSTYLGLASIIPLMLFRVREKSLHYISITTIQFIISVSFIIYFVVFLKQGAIGSIKGGLYASLILFIIYILLTIKEINFSFHFSKIIETLRFSLPLVPHNLAGWILSLSDKLILQRYSSLSEVGLYSLGYTLGMVMNLIVMSINFAWAPFFFDTAKTNKDAKQIFARITTLWMIFISFICISGILFSREIVILITTEKFYGSALVIPIILVSYFLNGMYFMVVNAIFYLKKTKVLPIFTFTTAMVNIGLNFWWIPEYGMIGAAYATLVSYIIQFLLVYKYSIRIYTIPYEYKKMGIVLIIFIAIYLVNMVYSFDNFAISIPFKFGLLCVFILGLIITKVIKLKEITKLKEIIVGKFARS